MDVGLVAKEEYEVKKKQLLGVLKIYQVYF